jgi:hypothetical protein
MLHVTKKYEHPDGLYNYVIRKGVVEIRVKTAVLLLFLNSPEYKQVQDLVCLQYRENERVYVSESQAVHIASRIIAANGAASTDPKAEDDGIKRKAHVIWLRAFNRFFLKPFAREKKPVAETLVLRYNDQGRLIDCARHERFTRRVAAKQKRPAVQQPSHVQLNQLIERYARTA